MTQLREKHYYERLAEIIKGNKVVFTGATNSDVAAEKTALNLTRALYGTTHDAPTTSVTHSLIGGITNEILEKFADNLENIDDKDYTKKLIQEILNTKDKEARAAVVIKIASVDLKIPLAQFNPAVAIEADEEEVEAKISMFQKAKSYLKKKSGWDILRTTISKGSPVVMMKLLEQQGLLNRGGLTHSIACVLGLVPLWHVQEIEVARSGKIIKFRATGSVFLANQEGGGDAVRIEGLLLRGEIFLLFLLWILYYIGSGDMTEFDISDPTADLLTIRKKLTNLIEAFNPSVQKPSIEKHKTFPFVSRHVIIPNCYIETISFEDKVVNGMDVVQYSLMLRTYDKQDEFQIYDVEDRNLVFAAPKQSNYLNYHRMFEYVVNFIYRTINQNKYVYDSGNWKVGVTKAGLKGKPQTKDLYYNVELDNIIGTFAMGIIGLGGVS